MLPTDDTSAAGYGLAAVAYLVLAAHLLWSGRRHAGQMLTRALPMGALFCTAAWAATETLGWSGAAGLLDVLRYALWCGFLLLSTGFVRPAGGSGVATALRYTLVAVLGTAVVVLAAAVLGGGPRTRLDFAMQLALPVGGCLLLEQLFRNLPEDSRWHAKPFCIGLACVFLFDVYMASIAMMFGGFDASALNARGIVHAIAVPFLFVSSQRSGDWVSKLQVSRKAVFHSATLLLAGVYLLLVASVGYYVRYFGGSWGGALQLTLLFAALAFGATAMLSTTVRAHLRVLVGKHFFRYRFDYREEWLRFTARLSARGSATEVAQHVVRGLADMIECASGGLWLRPDADGDYAAAARWNLPATGVDEPADGPLCRFLRDTGWVIDLDEWHANPGRYEGLVLPPWLTALPDAWLVVPLQVGSDLLGFVVLGRPRTAIDVDWEVLDLLKTASRQAAGYLAQMQATEALLEARKFEAFNRMSAFVVHDLKNIVTQLSLMLKNAERLHANPEFQQDMLLTVESSLEKMRRLMLQLREGATPPGGSAGVELEPIVARLQAMAAARGRALEVTQLERVATRGHDERIERVLGHLVHNALDATPHDGRVWIGVSRFSGQVMIEVGDTGSGMTEEFIQTRLFKPFSSTKTGGMGVGTYESQQYVRELGGSITVESEPGAGTVVCVRLPLFDRTRGSDLMPLDAIR